MRKLAILVKTGIADHAVLFMAALLASGVLAVLAKLFISMTDQGHQPQLYKIAFFLPVPIAIGIGFCAAGMVQVRTDRTRGVSGLLSVLPVTRIQIMLPRLVTVIGLTLVVFGPATAIWIGHRLFWRPEGYVAWLVPLQVALAAGLTGIACYSLGLLVGHAARTETLALGALPLAAILVLLIAIKGFGWSFVGVVALFAAACWICLLRSKVTGSLAVVSAALIMLVLYAGSLYWSRFLCDVLLLTCVPSDALRVEISPSGLVPDAVEADPEAVQQSVAAGWIGGQLWGDRLMRQTLSGFRVTHSLLVHLGIVDDLRKMQPLDDDLVDYYRYADYDQWFNHRELRFDEAKGQVCHGASYIGPEGMSGIPYRAALGRFTAPLVGAGALYDRGSNCFFAFDLEKGAVRKGPRKASAEEVPVEVGIPFLCKSFSCNLAWLPPCEDRLYRVKQGYFYVPGMGVGPYKEVSRYPRRYVPVLYPSGRIDLLDRDTLEVTRGAGALPRPKTLFGTVSAEPRRLLAYRAVLVPGPGEEYAGMVTASLPAQVIPLTLNVFDRHGKRIAEAHTQTPLQIPWGSALLVTKYVFESAHPTVLTLASLLAPHNFEPSSSHRAVFLMPNSFVTQQRDRETRLIFQLLAGLLFLLPALLLAGFLSWRVARDATAMGLSHRTRGLWCLATLAFGVPAYITYRLTRPAVPLVPCRDCGQGRRVDQDVCHHCGSGWNVPVLEPPAWRVVSP